MKIQISEVLGNSQKLDGGSMFGNAPKALWQKWIEPDSLNRIPLACRALLIEMDDYKILCEAGIGAFFEPKLADRFGVQDPQKHLLLENLAALNIKPDDIDLVILSHLHFDHAGGILPTYEEISKGHEALVFTKAHYVVGQSALERAENPHFRDRASFIADLPKKLKHSNRLIVIEDVDQGLKPHTEIPEEVASRIEFITSQGHTPGQLHTLIKGNEGNLFFAGDLIPGRAWVNLPITMGYDRFPEKLIEEKQNLYDRAASEKWWLYYTHDVEVALSKIAQNEKGKFAPTSPCEKPVRLDL